MYRWWLLKIILVEIRVFERCTYSSPSITGVFLVIVRSRELDCRYSLYYTQGRNRELKTYRQEVREQPTYLVLICVTINMAATALREKQAPLKEQYKSDPSSAIITLSSSGSLDHSSIACKIETGKAISDAKQKVAGLHQKAGGDDPEISGELCSGDMLLEALVACAGVTLKAVATALNIPIHSGSVKAEGDLDFKGTMGVDKNAPVGFTDIRLRFNIELENGAEVSEEQIEKLGKLTERYCVVLQTITKKPELKVHLMSTQETEQGVDQYLQWNHKA